jgi:site-specific recombinase XerD
MSSETYNIYECTEGDGRYKFVVRGRLEGKYVRKYFSTKREGETWAEIKNIEVKNQGLEHASFSTDLRREAQIAAELLKPHDVSLLEAVRIALPILEIRKKSVPIKSALEQFLDDYRLHGGPKTAVPSVSYLKYLADMLTPFRNSFSDHLVADVGIPQIEEFLGERKGAGAVTRQSYIRAISAFYSWCVHKGYRLENPMSKLRKKIPLGEASILSVAEAQKVMHAALGDEAAVVALALFCGIRIAEFHKTVRDTRGQEREVWLDWKDIDLKERQVFITPELDKNRHGRYVDIASNAISWLEPVRQVSGAVMPVNWRARRVALEERSGVDLPQNVLRHSFCSYRIALDQDYWKAAAMVGNSPAMLRKHYVRVLPRKLGEAYFKIRAVKSPENAKIVPFRTGKRISVNS